jgi:hypothetical protein
MLSRRRIVPALFYMPFAPLDLLLALAPAGVLLALSWALRRVSAAGAVGAQPVPEPERHGELLRGYAPADA